MLICDIIYVILMTAGLVIILPILFRNMLRFNVYITVISAAAVHALEELACMPFSPVCGNTAAMVINYLLTVVVTIMLIRFDRLIDMLIIYCFYQFLYNVIGTAIMVVSTVIYGTITGVDSDTWFDGNTSTVSDMIMHNIALALSFAVSLIICRKCMPIMVNMNMRLKLPLFAGAVVPVFVYLIVRNLVDGDSPQRLSGPMAICYGILLILMAVSFIVFFVNVFLQTKEENQLIQVKIKAQNEYYYRVLRVQQELREARHDLANQLVACNISQADESSSAVKN